MTRSDLRWILRLWRPHVVWLCSILVVTIVSVVVRIVLPLVLKRTFDGLEGQLTTAALLSATLLYFVFGTVDWILTTGLIFMRGTMNLRFEMASRLGAYRHLVRHAPGFFQRYRTGDLVTRLTDDVSEKLSWFICSGIFRAYAALALIVFALVMMVRLDPLLTLFTAGPLPLLILLFIRTGSLLDRRFEAVQQRISDLNGALEATFSGIRVVKAYGRESAEEDSFLGFARACRRAEIDAAKSQTLVDSLFGHVWQLGVVIVLLAGGIGVMTGRLTLGTFVAFDAYVLMLIFPMFDIGTFFVRGRQSAVSIGRLRELEETPPEITEPAAAVASAGAAAPDGSIAGRLRFDGVAYRYRANGRALRAEAPSGAHPGGASARPTTGSEEVRVEHAPAAAARLEGPRAALPDEPEGSVRAFAPGRSGKDGRLPDRASALEDIDFSVAPGEMVAVVGTVGAGKSTLLRLIPRINDPSDGAVRLDEADLRSLPLSRVREAIGYVPQEALLFSGTLRENIRFGREWIEESAIQSAAHTARLMGDLESLPAGFETRVGVRGVSLSGGQKQRAALARALAGRPRILVLDDVTAALDAHTEAELWDELHRVLPDLATIVVTHRTATLERADRILVLDRGRLVEQGSHAELSERGAVYRSIYRRHALEERVEGDGPAPAGHEVDRAANDDGG